MIIECNILNYDSVAEKLEMKGQRIWAKFVFNTYHMLGYSEWMENNEAQEDCTEVMFLNGRNFIIDVPFLTFDNMLKKDPNEMFHFSYRAK